MKVVPYDQSAQERLDSFLVKFDPAIETLARAVRRWNSCTTITTPW
jgi:hypothetical protein